VYSGNVGWLVIGEGVAEVIEFRSVSVAMSVLVRHPTKKAGLQPIKLAWRS